MIGKIGRLASALWPWRRKNAVDRFNAADLVQRTTGSPATQFIPAGTLFSKNEHGIPSPTRYGAVGDGVADDSDAVASASASASASAAALGLRSVFFPPGTYYVPVLAGSDVTDVIFVGDAATLTGCPFRKFIVPTMAPSIPPPPVTITPSANLKWSRIKASTGQVVKVIIAGDSMCDTNSSGLGPVGGLPGYIMAKLRSDNPSITFDFQIQGVGGATFSTMNNSFVTSSSVLANPISTTNGSKLVSVAYPAHNLIAGQNVAFSGAAAVGGLTISETYQVYDVTSADAFRIQAGSAAAATAGPGGGAAVTVSGLNSVVRGSWWQYGTATWIDGISSAAPDLVFLLLTSNDAVNGLNLSDFGNVMAVLDALAADVVFCTSPARSYDASASSTAYLNAEMTQEDEVAGFLAGYVLQNSRGLLDFARQGALVRDGFDPRTSAMYRPTTITDGTVTLPYTFPTTRDWSVILREFGSAGATAFTTTGEIQIQLGLNTTGSANDTGNVLRVGRDGCTGNLYYQVDTNSMRTTIAQAVTSYPAVLDGAGQYWLAIFKRGTYLYLSWQFENQVVFAGHVECFGGDFTPRITCTNGAQTAFLYIPCVTDYGAARMFMPELTNREMWGNPDYNPTPGFGGHHGVHPTTLLGERVYAPVLSSQNFDMTTCAVTATYARRSNLLPT